MWASVPGVHTRSGEAFVFRINFVRTDDGRWIPVTAISMSTNARRRPWVIF
ncbi:MAG: hypothetical protein HRU70_03190 [Phycisphaeraceae bacterium]|nr:MAG: hypothetical protein HRU70_03190 [Phycisphaeraceae bacterium]